MSMRFIGVWIGSSLLALVASCSSFGDGDENPIDPAADASADTASDTTGTSTDDATADDGGDGGSVQRFCLRLPNKNYRACDDFQTGPLLEAPWKSTLTVQDVDASVATLDSKLGDDFAHFVIPVMSGQRAAYLQHDFGTINKTTSFTFGMTVQVTGFGGGDYVEIAQLSGGQFGGGLAFDKGILRLYVSSGKTADISGNARDKQRIVVEATPSGLVARDGKGATIGELSYTFEGGLPTTLHLGVGLYFTTGITAQGTIDIDDVIIDY